MHGTSIPRSSLAFPCRRAECSLSPFLIPFPLAPAPHPSMNPNRVHPASQDARRVSGLCGSFGIRLCGARQNLPPYRRPKNPPTHKLTHRGNLAQATPDDDPLRHCTILSDEVISRLTVLCPAHAYDDPLAQLSNPLRRGYGSPILSDEVVDRPRVHTRVQIACSRGHTHTNHYAPTNHLAPTITIKPRACFPRITPTPTYI